MSDANIFGRIVTPGMVERAVIATVSLWIDDYLGEIERLEGYPAGAIERPRGIISASEFEKWPEDQIPVIIVVNGGLHGAPERHARGRYTAAWSVGVAPLVSDQDQAASRKLAMAYAGALRALILQHSCLKSSEHPAGFADYINWVDEQYGDIPFLASRNLAAARVVLEVGVDAVSTMHTGPMVPSGRPGIDPGPWPTAQVPSETTIPRSPVEAFS